MIRPEQSPPALDSPHSLLSPIWVAHGLELLPTNRRFRGVCGARVRAPHACKPSASGKGQPSAAAWRRAIPRSPDNTLAKLAKQQDRWNKRLNSKVFTLLYLLNKYRHRAYGAGQKKHLCHCLHIPTCSVNFPIATQHSVLMSYCICLGDTPPHLLVSAQALLEIPTAA